MAKILIIRFSSIGDIILTTPVIRCIKKQLPEVELHFLTKEKFAPVLSENPYIDKLILLKDDLGLCIDNLKKENYDFIADLHNNLRSHRILFGLRRPYKSFRKLNPEKWLYVNLKINRLPQQHIIERYFDTLKMFGIRYDNAGLDFFTPEIQNFPEGFEKPSGKYGVISVGAMHATKQIPVDMAGKIIQSVNIPFYLIGSLDDYQRAKQIETLCPDNTINICGKLSLLQSAEIVKNSIVVITPDSAIMHMAAAFEKNIISVWGNTVPAFGMSPLLPEGSKALNYISEVTSLSCRPCSKIGFQKCPKNHFNCMKLQDIEAISDKLYQITKTI